MYLSRFSKRQKIHDANYRDFNVKNILISLLLVFSFFSSVKAHPFTEMLKGGLKGRLKKDLNNNFKIGEKCVRKNCDEIEGILSTYTDSFSDETLCINYLDGEKSPYNNFMAEVGTFHLPLNKGNKVQYRLDNGTINTVNFGDLKYYRGDGSKADLSSGYGPAFYLNQTLWENSKNLRIRHYFNYSETIDFSYKISELKKYVKATRRCWSKYNPGHLVDRDKLFR